MWGDVDYGSEGHKGARLSEWTQAAVLAASEQHGWAYGTGVSDLARILRLVGSANRKTANWRPCRVIGGSGLPISPDSIPQPRLGRSRRTRRARGCTRYRRGASTTRTGSADPPT
jgi:hypothetical protein